MPWSLVRPQRPGHHNYSAGGREGQLKEARSGTGHEGLPWAPEGAISNTGQDTELAPCETLKPFHS